MGMMLYFDTAIAVPPIRVRFAFMDDVLLCVCVCVFIVSTIEYAILGFAAAVPVICVRLAGVYDVRRPTIKREIERAMNSLSAVAPRRQTDCTD